MSRRQKGRRPRWDALHRANDTEGRTEVLRLDGLMDEAGDFPADEIPQVHLGLADRLCSDPTPKLDGALDLAAERQRRSTSHTFARLRALERCSPAPPSRPAPHLGMAASLVRATIRAPLLGSRS